MNPTTVLAEVIVDQLILNGVSEVVVAPGSRNAPITMAFFRAHQAGRVRLHSRIDERSAAFLALGISKASNLPTVVICTSGSAAANFHPAMLEAHHSDIKLIAITADRPARLRRTGANQTTDQVNIFGNAVNVSLDIFAPVKPAVGQIAKWRAEISAALFESGPIHLNLQFEEPLLGDLDWIEPLSNGIPEVEEKIEALPHPLGKYETHGVILVGHDRAAIPMKEIESLSENLGWPILSEDPLSSEKVIPHASLLLSNASRRESLKPKIAMVIGRLTLSRSLNSYLELADYKIIVDSRIAEIDTSRSGDELHLTLPEVTPQKIDSEWMKVFVKSSAEIQSKVLTHLKSWSEPAVVNEFVSQLPRESALFVASSRPIRDIESFATPRSNLETFANRGLAGIDGNISTAIGIALNRKKTFAVLGDLAFLHDINGLLLGPEEVKPDLIILVVSNDGGGIFSTLPQNGVAGFERIFGTPHGRSIAKIAESYGIPAIEVRTLEALRAQISRDTQGIRVIVALMPNRESNATLLKQISADLD
jgi:2-succinyl-5-enolpyruvyl-6-hydroxy-3-cyclohexene-1-carboxylate synthase